MNVANKIKLAGMMVLALFLLNACVDRFRVEKPSQTSAGKPLQYSFYQPNKIEIEVLTRVNVARQSGYKCGSDYFPPVRTLRISEELSLAATKQARDMALGGFFSHVGIDGNGVGQRISATGYTWNMCGENIAFGQFTPKQVVYDWLKSPGHCKNIMNSGFQEMGVSSAKSKNRTYWVQTFGSR